MNYKVEGALNKNRKTFVVAIILWLFIAIVFIPPIAFAIAAVILSGGFDLEIFVSKLGESLFHSISAISALAKKGMISVYIKSLIVITFFYAIVVIVGVVKSAPKNEYSDIEHGSSDWSQRGEQYQILSKNKGIILAEDNYLPLDKRGNANVLVVGRFRFW
jgi:hypothetical protein